MDQDLDPDALLAQLAAEAAPKLGFYGKQLGPRSIDQARYALGQVERGEQQETTTWTGKYNLKAIRYSHADCIDRLIANPGVSRKALAMLYGVTVTWLGIVMNCDAFKAALAARREELIDPTLLATIQNRYEALAEKSLEVLMEKLDRPTEQISDKLAIEAAQLGAKVFGVGEQKSQANATDHLASIAHRLVDLNRQAAPPAVVIDEGVGR